MDLFMFNKKANTTLASCNQVMPSITMHTRLGKIDVAHENIFYFESGLFGFEKDKKFGLGAMLGVPENAPFMILQSFDSDDLCFILFNNNMETVQNVGQTKNLLLKHDIDHVASNLSMDVKDLRYAFVISTNESMKNNMSINTMAPIFFNIEQKTGWQIVLNNPMYNICEPLC
jgi:flagellar assembly factor FliW